MSRTPPKTVDEYLDSVSPEERKTLEELRQIIKATAPEAVEAISYQVPTFKLFGSLVALGAAKSHCSLYVMSSTTLDGFTNELKGYDTSKGTIRFPVGEPLPVDLIEKLVKTRVEENEAGAVQSVRR